MNRRPVVGPAPGAVRGRRWLVQAEECGNINLRRRGMCTKLYSDTKGDIGPAMFGRSRFTRNSVLRFRSRPPWNLRMCGYVFCSINVSTILWRHEPPSCFTKYKCKSMPYNIILYIHYCWFHWGCLIESTNQGIRKQDVSWRQSFIKPGCGFFK